MKSYSSNPEVGEEESFGWREPQEDGKRGGSRMTGCIHTKSPPWTQRERSDADRLPPLRTGKRKDDEVHDRGNHADGCAQAGGGKGVPEEAGGDFDAENETDLAGQHNRQKEPRDRAEILTEVGRPGEV